MVDPGLDGDVYADEPYLYGPAASSLNVLFVEGEGDSKGKEAEEEEDVGLVFEEGGDEAGEEHRRECGIPDGEAARKKYFLTEAHRKEWNWEAGKSYGCDFFNAYLDFNSEWLLSVFCSVCLRLLVLPSNMTYRFCPQFARLSDANYEGEFVSQFLTNNDDH